MGYKPLLWAGVLAVVFYVAAVIIGSVLRPGYSQVGNFVSELIETGAPNKGLLNPLFILYNLFTAIFGVGFWMFVKAKSPASAANLGKIGAVIILAEAVFGLVTVFFPQDVRGTPVTSTGTMHIVLAGLCSLATMGAMLLVGLWFRNVPGMNGYAWYSFISLAIVFISGGLAAFTGATNSPILGVMERLAIGGFLQWLLILGMLLPGLPL